MPEEEAKKKGHESLEEWKVKFKDGTVFAPVTYDNLLEWFKSGQIDAETPVAKNALTAEWVQFKETEGFATAKAAKEGRQVFCITCGAGWPVGTKFCTKCGTFLETGEKITAVGEKKPQRAVRLPSKAEGAPPELLETAAVPEEVAGEAEAAEVPEMPVGVEAPEVEEAEAPAVAAPALPKKRGKKILVAVIAVAAVVAALAVLAPEKMADIVQKVKDLAGLKGRASKSREAEEETWAGVGDDARSAVEALRGRLSSTLAIVPFAERHKGAFEGRVADFLRNTSEEFTDTDTFVSVATALTQGDLREAARLLEEEKNFLGTEILTPRIDATLGAVQVLLGREKKGLPLLAESLAEEDVRQVAATFCRGAVEGCLERLLPAQGRRDPWSSAAEILGVKKEELTDDFLAKHAGKALSALGAVQSLTAKSPEGVSKEFRTKAFVRLFGRAKPSVQAALVELGKSDPAKRPSVLRHPPAGVAYALGLMSARNPAEEGADQALLEVLKKGLSADPDNAFYDYALGTVYLGMNRKEEALAALAAGNQKPSYTDYSKERIEGLAEVLDISVPYTAAVMRISSPHLAALARSSRTFLEMARSSFRVGDRKKAFDMLTQWRDACERLSSEACCFRDAWTVIAAAVPVLGVEAELYKKGGEQDSMWEARKALARNRRMALAMTQGAPYGVVAYVFVKELFSEGGYGEEAAAGSPQQTLGILLSKATGRLDQILRQDPAKAQLQGVDSKDRYYLAAETFLAQARYESAFDHANACLARNPRHVWALKVMEQALARASVEVEDSRSGPVVYWLVRKIDLSLPGAKRVEYQIGVAKETSEEQAIATARSALQGFWKREKADAVRVSVVPQGNLLPYVRLDWAPSGDWDTAKEGTPYTEFDESLKVFEPPTF